MENFKEDVCVPVVTRDPSNYVFPRQRLKQVQSDSSRELLVLVACGKASMHVFLLEPIH